MGISTCHLFPNIPTEQWKGRGCSQIKIVRAAWVHGSIDETKLTRALLQYRNTPSQRDQLSPAQKLFGQPIQDTLPAHRRAFAPQWQTSAEEAEQHATTNTEQVEHRYNQHARALPEIQVGCNVAIQNTATKLWDIYGIVTAISPHRRYFVKTASGRVLVRNRRFLRRRIPIAPPAAIPGAPQPPLVNDSTPNPPPPLPRRSTRQHTRPNRLIEEVAFT